MELNLNSTKHTIINGDSTNMDIIADDSVQLIVTSPPYWNIKDYGTKNQLGFYDTYEQYIEGMNQVWEESYRVLENGCKLCINIGDQFTRTSEFGRYKIMPIHSDIIQGCEKLGFDYMGAILWHKFTNCNSTGGGALMGSYPNPRNGIVKFDYEYILLFKKLGTPKKIDRDIKLQSSMTKEQWKEYFQGSWRFSGERQKNHIAMFPLELPQRLIQMYSFVGETVLDPFMGSGTTALAARQLNRNSIGYEINKEYMPLIEEKVGYVEFIKTNEEEHVA